MSVNGHPDRAAVPLGWVQYWAHEVELPVWATGNQHLKIEAAIPGLAEAEELWEDDLGNDEYQYSNSEFEHHFTPRRRDGLRLIQELYEATFPDEPLRFMVVDDVDVSDLAAEGPWTHYFPWDFVAVVEAGVLKQSHGLLEPPNAAYRNDGVPFNSTPDPDFEAQQSTIAEIKQHLGSLGDTTT
jgi:hypothetical protein